MFRPISFAVIPVLLMACATTELFTLLPVGVTSVGDLNIDVTPGWNEFRSDPKAEPPRATWTSDGLLLDRVVIYAGVADDQTLVKEQDKSAALPRFHADMTPNELVALIESYLVKMFGEGQALVGSSNLRPQRYGADAGILFDVAITPAEIAYYKGTIGAFVANQKLYLIMYIGADPYYYDKHRAVAEQMIASARL
jgi:hypothetical protein